MKNLIFKKTLLRIIFIFPFLLFSLFSSAERTQFKLAIVDVGEKEKIPAEFIDLVYLSFEKYPEIILLERMEIEKILREHAINKSFSVKELVAGKFLTTDGFLMLERDKLKESVFLRIRLVETKYGFKLSDFSIPFPSGKADYKTLADKISQMIREKIKKIKDIKKENLIVVGISFIRSEEISEKWGWLSDVITTGIEQTMNLYPGVILLERMRTRTLKEEREIVSKLPESLKSSSLLIDGSFKIEKKKGSDILSVYIRCRTVDGRIVYKGRIKGAINKLDGLYKKICEEIIKTTGMKKEDIKQINPEIEGEILANSAEFYLINNEFEKAISLAEASVSLCSDSIKYNQLLLTIYAEYLEFLTGSSRVYGSLSSRSLAEKREIIKILFRCNSIIEHLHSMWNIKKHPAPPTFTPYYFPYTGHREKALVDISFIIANRLKNLSPPPDELKNDFSELFQSYLRLRNLECKFYEEKANFYEKKAPGFKREMLRRLTSQLEILPLFPNVDEAISFSRDIFNKASRLYKELGLKFNWKINSMSDYETYFNLNELTEIFVFPSNPEWARKKEAKNKAGRFFEECFKKTDYLPLKVYLAYHCLYFFSYGMNNYKKAKEYLKYYLTLSKQYLEINHEWDIYDATLWVSCRRVSDNEKENREIKIEIVEHFLETMQFLHKKKIFNEKSFRKGWESVKPDFYFLKNVLQISDVEKICKEVYEILKKPLPEKPENISRVEQLISLLKERIKTKPVETSKYKIIKILSLNEALKKKISGSPSFRRLIFDNDNVKGIVYSISFYSSEKKREKFGIIKLDKDFSILSITESPFETKPFHWLLNRRYIWPSFICHDGNIYLGLHGNGMLIFYKDGKVKLINEDNGLSSNNIILMKLLKNGKIYALTGDWVKRGLMEFDPETENSKIIFSTRSISSEQEINGEFILNITESEDRSKLWILTFNDYRLNIFLYDPENNKITNLLKNFPHGDIYRHELYRFLAVILKVSVFSEIDGKLIIGGWDDVAELDIKKKKVTFLLMSSGSYHVLKKWKETYSLVGDPLWVRPEPIGPLINILLSENGIIFIGDENKRKLYYFRKGEAEGEDISKKEKLPPIRDALITKKGLFILTSESLYLLPEIKK